MKKILIIAFIIIWTLTACMDMEDSPIRDTPSISDSDSTTAPSTTPFIGSALPGTIPPDLSDLNFDYAIGLTDMFQKSLDEVERLLTQRNIPYAVNNDNEEYSSITLTSEEDAKPTVRFEFYLDEALQFRLGLIAVENSISEKGALRNAIQHFGNYRDTWKDDSERIYYEFHMSDGTYYTLSCQLDKAYSYFSTFLLDYHSPLGEDFNTLSIEPELMGVVITNEEGTCTLDYSMFVDDTTDEISKLGSEYEEAIRAYSENISLYEDNSIATSSGDFRLTFRSSGSWELSLNGLSFKLFNLVGTNDSVDTLYRILGKPYRITYNTSKGYWLQYKGEISNKLCTIDIQVSESKVIGTGLRLEFV